MHTRSPMRLLLAVLLLYSFPIQAATPEETGERIYRQGVLESGAPLEARREGGLPMQGADAACVNCHRRSGFGSREGRIVIPPVGARYLLRAEVAPGSRPDLPYVETMRLDRDPPYSDATLARAIREGVNADGKPFSYLMPRYALSDADMAATIAYLKKLDRRSLPGVTDTTLHFSTIITPDADPTKRRGMLDVLSHYFTDHNNVQFAITPHLHSSNKMAWANNMFRVHYRWELHVWQLKGAPATWEAQLKNLFARQPVLAVVSGLGGKNWEPVHAFCEDEQVPCFFPNVEVPPQQADSSFYSLYFSRGVMLEAGLISNKILDSASAQDTVVQIYRKGDSGEPAALALADALRSRGIVVRNHALPPAAKGRGVAQAVRSASNGNALVLWLRPPDLKALGKAPKVPVYLSGLMGGLEYAPLPSGWRSRTRLAYPFDLPEQHRVPVDYALGWFRIRGIPVVSEQVQADTYLACGLLSETLNHMSGNLVPEYFVERIQDMLDRRIITGYYPHLALAPGQRFASKGGYLAHFAEASGPRLVADSGWIVP
jgi:hypothetical protein